jgi:hypothetical protein
MTTRSMPHRLLPKKPLVRMRDDDIELKQHAPTRKFMAVIDFLYDT